MCYPKPGPRCSAHAAIRLAKAKANLANPKEVGFDEYTRLRKSVDEAQVEFDITPAGLRFLEEEILHGDYKVEERTRYAHALALREEKLAAIKGKLENKKHDQVEVVSFRASFKDSEFTRLDEDDEAVADRAALEASAWLHKLTTEQMTQVRWMTDYGAMQTNTHIAKNNDYKFHGGIYPAEELERRMLIIDEALATYETNEPQVVYRGVRKGILPNGIGDNYRVSDEDKKALFLQDFKVGEVYESNYYLPASSQPSKASGFSDFGVVMEIKTRKAVPVSSISLVPHEAERLIGRNGRFKVTAVLENVYFGKSTQPKTVVQLEQL